MKEKKYLAVIFDKDGVIADSEYCNVMAKHIQLKQAGITVDWHYHDQFLGTTHEYMWTVMKEELHLPEEIDYYIKQWSEVRKELIEKEGIRAMPGSIDLIKRIKSEGIPIAVASSSNVADIEADLRALGIEDIFDTVISGEHCQKGKPDPEIFLKAAKALGVEPKNCVVIEDSTSGVAAAKAAGMKCIGFAHPDAVKQDIHLADEIITDFDKLSVEHLMAKNN
ncbi:MAG: HAD family phosphatase [Lachnospiraceae bacterium]|nr:HAD family phosphatase [Lachnospiraceae bacterium]